LRAKNPKPSHWGSISGTPSEMGVESGRGRWCSGADEVVVVVGRCVCKCEAGEGAEGQKYKIKPLGLDLGALSEMEVESSEGRWHDGADEVVVVVGH